MLQESISNCANILTYSFFQRRRYYNGDKERTGFVCALLEALAGAGYEEMLSDYMITYQNYYKVPLDKTSDKYNAIAELYFNSFLSFLHGTDDPETLRQADYTEDVKAYLINGGMTEEEIAQLLALISR